MVCEADGKMHLKRSTGIWKEQMEAIPQEEVRTDYIFMNAVGMEIFSTILTVLLVVGRMFVSRGAGAGSLWAVVMGLGIIASAALVVKYGIRLFRFSTPERRMRQISQAVLDALIEIGEMEDIVHCKTEVESLNGLFIGTRLKGGSMRDKTTFACCMEEIWGIIDNPRYLLTREKDMAGMNIILCRKCLAGRKTEPLFLKNICAGYWENTGLSIPVRRKGARSCCGQEQNPL